MRRIRAVFASDEHQYGPFIAGALFFGIVIGFPLGLTVAHARAQGGTLGAYGPALTQVHGHLQLMGFVGLFVIGMGYRLVARFTAVRLRSALVPGLTFAFVAGGLFVRSFAQPLADRDGWAVVFAGATVFETAGVLLFSATILHCLARGRKEDFLYTPFFAAGALWAGAAAALNLVFVLEAVSDGVRTIDPLRSLAASFVLFYGFAAMFIFGVALRTFPIFFQRRRAPRQATLAAWAVANLGIAAYTGAVVWRSYEPSADTRLMWTAGFLAAGVALGALVVLLRVFEGEAHRVRPSAQRSIRFVRSAFAWLLVAVGFQIFYSLRALVDGRYVGYFEADAVRHFLGLGFVTMMILGMAFMVMPRLAMRRMVETPSRIVAPALLWLMNGTAAARGFGAVLAAEKHLDGGYWMMTVGGTFGVLAILIFAVYLVWSPKSPEILLSARGEEAGPQGPIEL